jgi:hypothetical protein
VKKGDLIWRFDSRIDRVFADWEVEHLPDLLRRFLEVYSNLPRGIRLWILSGDHGRHFNHSDEPNTTPLGIGFGDDIAGGPSGRSRAHHRLPLDLRCRQKTRENLLSLAFEALSDHVPLA